MTLQALEMLPSSLARLRRPTLLPDDGLVETIHEVSPLAACAPRLIKIRTLIKTGNLTCWQGPLSDQV